VFEHRRHELCQGIYVTLAVEEERIPLDLGIGTTSHGELSHIRFFGGRQPVKTKSGQRT
jgi:hypothetical protein